MLRPTGVYMFANDQLGTLKRINAISELSDDAAKQVKGQNSGSVIESVTGSDGKLTAYRSPAIHGSCITTSQRIHFR